MSEWIEWKGGECPVGEDVEVEARLAGVKSVGDVRPAHEWCWRRYGGVADIVAYRVIEKAADKMQAAAAVLDAQPVPAEDRMFWDGEKMHSTKPSNPKDAIGDTKVPLAFLSPIAKAHWALAQHCGLVKYGAWNWREAGVRASVYISAIGRHMDGYLSGEQLDPADGTHHLGNVMACCAILLEAEARGNLTDDRPPKLDMRPAYAFVEQAQAALNAKYADRNPKHWTIGDTL